ncbi:MAG TPA: hypothetical protein VFH70_09910 [Acidimicrobiales bacterium]|nr:hypothetical protein [Acidimicrobiales bacterium]
MSRWPKPVRTLALTAAAVGTVLVSLPGGIAWADSPSAVGWWTTNELAGTPIGVGATVARGALQVAEGPDGPMSVAAIRLPAGTAGATFTLPLANSSTPLPYTVVACPTTSAWKPVSGGPLTNAPRWDCSDRTASSAYDPSADTLTWQFDGSFVHDGIIDVALLPIAGSQAFVATSAVPGPDSVRRQGARVSAPPTTASVNGAPTGSAVPEPAGVAPPVPVDTGTVPVAPGSAGPAIPAVTVPRAVPTGTGASMPVGLSPLPTPAQAHLKPASRPGLPWLGRAFGILLLVGAAVAVAANALGFPRAWKNENEERGVGRFRARRTAGPEMV